MNGRTRRSALRRASPTDACPPVAVTIVTCTTAREPFLGLEHVRPGTFVAAVGADNPAKNELRPELMANATVVADVVEQALVMGDLHHAVAAGIEALRRVRRVGQVDRHRESPWQRE